MRDAGLAWMTQRPVAHRGLHDSAAGILENTRAAFVAAMAGGYGIETDLQISRDGEAMIHHDDALGRLTEGTGLLRDLTADDLQRVPFKFGRDPMMTLPELCALAAGRTPLLLELKSRGDGDLRLVRRVAEVMSGYGGAAAAMSFDHRLVQGLREHAPALVRGLVAERAGPGSEFAPSLAEIWDARPQFVAYSMADLPAVLPWVARRVLGMPVLTWTVRSAGDWARAARWADQMIFEGFRP